MIYQFECESCGVLRPVESKPFHPPERVVCSCGKPMQRVYGCTIDTSGCKDHDDIPEDKRVARSKAPRNTAREEARFQRHIEERRSAYAREGQSGSFKHTHSIPADLYHGKIRQTGDKDYWKDPKNLKRHNSTRVS